MSLPSDVVDPILVRLSRANAAVARRYPGESGDRQPVHTVYGGAHLFRADLAAKLGAAALKAMRRYAPDAETLARAVGLNPDGPLARDVHERVDHKLRTEPVEDFRIDFEDGFGNRPDAEEDTAARSAAAAVAEGLAAGTLPPFIGIRIKPLSGELYRRSLSTLDVFLETLLDRAGRLPERFYLTLPKITSADQVSVLADVLAAAEASLGLVEGSLVVEIMVETHQSLVDAEGRSALPLLVAAGGGRIRAAHFGVYDYTASCGVTAAHQGMRHPVCDTARHLMQIGLGGTGVWLCDGATNVLPVAPVPAPPGGALDPESEAANRRAVHAAWRLHFDDVTHSLTTGFYQGWDLHPAQLVTRYAAVYAFFLEGLDAATARLKNFVAQAAQATLVGDVFDDAATGQALLNYFLRGLNCGAITEAEAAATGLSRAELESRSFVEILAGRRSVGPRGSRPSRG